MLLICLLQSAFHKEVDLFFAHNEGCSKMMKVESLPLELAALHITSKGSIKHIICSPLVRMELEICFQNHPSAKTVGTNCINTLITNYINSN